MKYSLSTPRRDPEEYFALEEQLRKTQYRPKIRQLTFLDARPLPTLVFFGRLNINDYIKGVNSAKPRRIGTKSTSTLNIILYFFN